MTNFDHWQQWNKKLPSAQIFIDLAWYATVTSALERRVWMVGVDPVCEDAIWPNMFVMFTGSPGAGKGRAMSRVTAVLNKVKEGGEKVFFAGPASGSMQGIVKELSECEKQSGLLSDGTPYVYNSMFIEAKEMGVLFKKNDTDMTVAFQQLFDSMDFHKRLMDEKKSIHIDNICVNLIAATQADWIKTNLGAAHFGEGFMSRFIIVHADKPRFEKMPVRPELEQVQSKLAIIEHLRKLSKLHGRVELTPEAIDYCKSIIEHEDPTKTIRGLRVNKSPFLEGYYDRKMLAWFKLAMGVHFSESVELLMGKAPFETAYNILSYQLEPNMHKAFEKISSNPNYEAGQKLLAYLRQFPRGLSKAALRVESNQNMTKQAFDETLDLWLTTGQVKLEGNLIVTK